MALRAVRAAGADGPTRRRAVAPGRLDPIVRYAVRALDPVRKCGAGTSVQLLYRVDASADGRSASHLVYLDRHGWYCEHGRTCAAVAVAKRFSARGQGMDTGRGGRRQ